MSVRMIVSDDPNAGSDRVALYDSVTGFAFGPVFPNVEAAEAFLAWLPVDARRYDGRGLEQMYSRYVELTQCPS